MKLSWDKLRIKAGIVYNATKNQLKQVILKNPVRVSSSDRVVLLFSVLPPRKQLITIPGAWDSYWCCGMIFWYTRTSD